MIKMTDLQMNQIEAGLPCWAAWAIYGGSLVGLGLATGGAATALAIVMYGASIYGVIDACT
jgi:hypothetical protein